VCLVGGIYSFGGPIIGAFLYMVLDHVVTGLTEYWPLSLGLGILLIAIFFRGGVAGFIMQAYRDLQLKRGSYDDIAS
jgi:branched-chain amino acid transport system permease protein